MINPQDVQFHDIVAEISAAIIGISTVATAIGIIIKNRSEAKVADADASKKLTDIAAGIASTLRTDLEMMKVEMKSKEIEVRELNIDIDKLQNETKHLMDNCDAFISAMEDAIKTREEYITTTDCKSCGACIAADNLLRERFSTMKSILEEVEEKQ